MASEEANNLGDLLDRASRLDGEQRATFLSAVLRDHPELRARVERMLQPEDDTLLMQPGAPLALRKAQMQALFAAHAVDPHRSPDIFWRSAG